MNPQVLYSRYKKLERDIFRATGYLSQEGWDPELQRLYEFLVGVFDGYSIHHYSLDWRLITPAQSLATSRVLFRAENHPILVEGPEYRVPYRTENVRI